MKSANLFGLGLIIMLSCCFIRLGQIYSDIKEIKQIVNEVVCTAEEK